MNKRAVHSAGQRVAQNGAFGRKLKIIIRCGLLREGFQGPLLIFRKAKGFKALNPTTRICENRIFNQYFSKQIIAHYIVLNRFYQQAAEFGKPGGPQFAADRSFPVRFPPASAEHYVFIDRMQYLTRPLSRLESKDQARKNRMFSGEPKNIQNTVPGKQSGIIAGMKNGKSADSTRIARRSDTDQTEPAAGLAGSKPQLTVREVFLRKDGTGPSVAGVPEAQAVFIGREASSAQRTVSVLEKSGSLERFFAEDRIIRMVAECSAFKNTWEPGQMGFSAQPSMLFPDGAGLRETGHGRIERLFSDDVAISAGKKVGSVPLSPQTDKRQTYRPVSKQGSQVFSRVVSNQSIDVSSSRRFDPFRNAVRNPDRAQPEFSETGLGQDHERTQVPGKSGIWETRATRIIKETETHAMSSAFKQPGSDQVGSTIPRGEALRSEALPTATRIRNKPAGEDTRYLKIKRAGEQSVLHEKQADARIDEKYAVREIQYPFPLPEANAGEQVASGAPMQALKATGQNKRFMTQIIAQSRRILNRMKQTSVVPFGLQKGAARHENGMRRMPARIDSVSVPPEQTKAERSGISNLMSFSDRVPSHSEPAKESKSSRGLPEFDRIVYQKNDPSGAFSMGRQAASATNGPGPGARRPEFVLKNESALARPIPVNRPVKETEDAAHPVQTLYDSDAKKNQSREINVIADRVYRILEKRIAIERDRRGFA